MLLVKLSTLEVARMTVNKYSEASCFVARTDDIGLRGFMFLVPKFVSYKEILALFGRVGQFNCAESVWMDHQDSD